LTVMTGRRRFHVLAAAVAVLVVGSVVVWVVWPDGDPVRERRYRAESACLFTGEQGLRGPVAQPVWAGMQKASLETLVQVSYLSVAGEQTERNATSYLGGLVQQECELLIAVDDAPVAAVVAAAASYPKQKFVVVDGAQSSNVHLIPGTADASYALLRDEFGDDS
jgi:basic membrane lipoprotein Med (substrate-binding protein (PBP1-ABC) superfamily)